MITIKDVIDILMKYREQKLLAKIKQEELSALEEYLKTADESFEIEGEMLKASTISDMPSNFSNSFYSKTETVALKDITHNIKALKRIITRITLATNKIDILIENLSTTKRIIIKHKYIELDPNFRWDDVIQEIQNVTGRVISKRSCLAYKDEALEELKTMLENTQSKIT